MGNSAVGLFGRCKGPVDTDRSLDKAKYEEVT